MTRLEYLEWLFEPYPVDPKVEVWLESFWAERMPPKIIMMGLPGSEDNWVYDRFINLPQTGNSNEPENNS